MIRAHDTQRKWKGQICRTWFVFCLYLSSFAIRYICMLFIHLCVMFIVYLLDFSAYCNFMTETSLDGHDFQNGT